MFKVKKIKVLKAKTSHPHKQTFLISDLTFIKKNPYPNTLDKNKRNNWMSDGMNDPIEVIKHTITLHLERVLEDHYILKNNILLKEVVVE